MTDEITLLRRYGPTAEPVADEALARARTRLDARVTTATAVTRRRYPRRVLVFGAAAAALTVAGAAALPRALRDGSRPRSPIALVDFTTPVFPVDLQPRPAELAAPVFTADDIAMLIAVYASQSRRDDVYVAVTAQRPDVGRATPVTVGGKPATFSVSTGGDLTSAALNWQRRPDQWVGITGQGRYATEAALRVLAGVLVDATLPVTLDLRLAPQGWQLRSFKPEVVTLADPRHPDRTLTVYVIDALDPDFAHSAGAQGPAQQVRVNGRPAQLVQAQGIWILQAMLPDGSPFGLQAPTDLTADQVLAIAGKVSKT